MATPTRRRQAVKQDESESASQAGEVIRDQIEALACRRARELLMAALDEEVETCLGRGCYRRDGDFRGYRNGTTPRRLTPGEGTVALAQPRDRDVPDGQEPFQSKIIRRYQRRSDTIDETSMKLFIEGLATRDFEPALRLLRGEQAPLSASVISRLTQRFRATYESLSSRVSMIAGSCTSGPTGSISRQGW